MPEILIVNQKNKPKNICTLPTLEEYVIENMEIKEKEYLQELIAKSNRCIKCACRISGLNYYQLKVLLKKHELKF